MNQLCEIAAKYGTDKHNHAYFPDDGDLTAFYDSLFGARRHEIKKVLEIGIGTPASMLTTTRGIYGDDHCYQPGASLRMWAEYFPQAEIFALDIDESVLINEGRIHSCLCDQSDVRVTELATQFLGDNFDVIIDDGSHVAQDQVLTAQILVSLLNGNGTYVIEDVVAASEITVACQLPDFHVKHFYGRNGLLGNTCFVFQNRS